MSENQKQHDQQTRPLDRTVALGRSEESPLETTDGPELPRPFGRYTLVRILGEGAMGSVYLAEDSQLDRQVALKVPKFNDSETEEVVQRFYREARSAANLRHANICPVYDVGEIDGTHYIAMAYIEGRPLASYIGKPKQITPRSAASIIRKLALALAEAHENGIVHRDLKPANIMIDSRSEPIIMDFGLARHAEQSEHSRLTQAGTIIGTPAYMSPEQFDGRPESIGPVSDIYSLGVMFYELLTGKLPYSSSGSVVTIIKEKLTSIVPSPSTIRKTVDCNLSRICEKAMAREVADRYHSMEQLANDLTVFLKGAGSSDQPMSSLDDDSAVRRMELQRGEVESLYKQGQFLAAAAILNDMARDSNPVTKQYAAWAERELPAVQAKIEHSHSPTQAATLPELPRSDSDPYRPTQTLQLDSTLIHQPAPPATQQRQSGSSPWAKYPPWLIAVIAGPIVLCLLLLGIIIGLQASTPSTSPAEQSNDSNGNPLVAAVPDASEGESEDEDEDEDQDEEEYEHEDEAMHPRRRLLRQRVRALLAQGADFLESVREIRQEDLVEEFERLGAEDRALVSKEFLRAIDREREWKPVALADANGDRQVSREELLTFYTVDEDETAERPSFATEMLERYDENEDERVDWDELEGEVVDFFLRGNDENQDDALDFDELNGIAERFGRPLHDHPPRDRKGGPPPPPPNPRPRDDDDRGRPPRRPFD